MSMLVLCSLQALFAVTIDDQGPVRFGVPLPAAVLQKGLRLQAGDAAVLQWRPLQPRPDPRTGRQWVEIALAGPPGRIGIGPGRQGPGGGRVYGHAIERREDAGDLLATEVWSYVTGDRDQRQRRQFGSPIELDGEAFAAGEALTAASEALSRRSGPVLRLPRRLWVAAGVLPEDRGACRELRRRLAAVAAALVELPGRRGRGDFGRSGDVVTNLEYDTTLAFAQLALASGEEALLRQAQRCARHTLDTDLDRRTGLPFAHGSDHRRNAPEIGHCWLRGMLLVGCLCADDALLEGARSMALALAQHPPLGEELEERAREYAWPLWELEGYLAFADEPAVARAADRLAQSIAHRFDAVAGTFRFGEGEVEPGVYFERAWITAGVVLPALRAHLRRRPQPPLQRMVDRAEERLLEVLGNGEPGVPTHYRIGAGGAVTAQHRAHDDPCGAIWLEGLRASELRRLLRKGGLWRALGEVPAFTDDDLATSFTMLARCSWVYR